MSFKMLCYWSQTTSVGGLDKVLILTDFENSQKTNLEARTGLVDGHKTNQMTSEILENLRKCFGKNYG